MDRRKALQPALAASCTSSSYLAVIYGHGMRQHYC
jgi:hypothetical protein